MPLSEEELRLLEQMERALVEEDPKFASTLRGTSLRRAARRRAMIAGVAFVIGIVVLMTGAVTRVIPVGIVGFVIMLVSATVALTAIRGQQAVAASGEQGRSTVQGLKVFEGGRSGSRNRRRGGSNPARGQRQGSFMERMEARWRQRRDQNGGF